MKLKRPKKVAKKKVVKPTVTKIMKDLAKDFMFTNAMANKLATKAKKARATLLEEMQNGKIQSFKHKIINDDTGDELEILVSVNTPERKVVDVEALKRELPEETWQQILAASPPSLSAVGQYVGKATLDANTKLVEGTTNVNIKKI